MLACLLKGTYNQTMDAKGRMTFPTKLRELIGERFIVTKGIDGCLFVYSLEDFEKRAEKIKRRVLSELSGASGAIPTLKDTVAVLGIAKRGPIVRYRAQVKK